MTQILLFLAGLATLVLGGDLLVRGASRLALSFGLTPLVVGLTVVAFGTSAPEMAVGVGAAARGQSDLALGNAIGSNIFNVLFILGLSALIRPLSVSMQVIRQEVPILLGATALLVVLALDHRIDAFDAALLLACLAGYTVFLLRQARRAASDEAQADGHASARRWLGPVLFISVGLALLVLGSEMLVSSAVTLARELGVSELVIGLTIVAAGTSMPEVAASIIATLRGERDIAIGNVIGSCVFNLLGVLGLTALAAQWFAGASVQVPPSVMHFDLWVLGAVSLACLPVFFSGRQISRWEGALFLSYYAAYTLFLILRAQQHDSLGSFSEAMIGFVLPLTVVTLVASAMPRPSTPPK